MPVISVIVPVYKVEPYLRRCIDSILGQTFTDFELILVDDGSPDNCGAICDEYAAKDSRVVVIHQKNGGLSAARNAGIDWVYANSNSQWLTFIDSDDWVSQDMLETMMDRIQSDCSDMAICGVETVYDDSYCGVRYPSDFKLLDECLSQKEIVSRLVSHSWGYVIACNKVFSRTIFEQIRFPEGFIHEDAAIIHHVYSKCNRVSIIDRNLYFYRQLNGSIMGADFSVRRTDNLSALADRISFSAQQKWDELLDAVIIRYVHSFFDLYFRFFRCLENEKYYQRMDNSLKLALPHILRCRQVSLRHKVYLLMIRINPQIYTTLKKFAKNK